MGHKGFLGFLLVLAATPALMLALHCVLNRIPFISRRLARQFVPVLCCFSGIVPVGYILWAVYLSGLSAAELLSSIAYAAVVYLALCYCYFHLFNMSETARRVRILCDIYSGGKGDSGLSDAYQAGAMIDARLQRLVATGQVKVSGGYYLISSRTLLYAARLLFLWGRVLGFKGPETRT
ncbi:MAG: hypothetical protein ACE5GY_01730 [Thermodesulfobacteriota bacterium]